MTPIDLRVEGTRQEAMETARNRMIVVMVLFVLGFLSLMFKVVQVGVFQANVSGYFQKSAGSQSVVSARGDILDRNGVVLATNLRTPSLAISKIKMRATNEELAERVSAVLPELEYKDVLAILNQKGNHHYIKRVLTPAQEYAIKKIGDPGLVVSHHEKRMYPQGRLAAHILGAVDIDNNPKIGVEAFFNDHLSDPEKSEQPLTLSVDIRLQHILHQELSNHMELFSADGAAGVILDVRSGEILALSSLPDFDPNDLNGPKGYEDWNKIFQQVYELGSGFKTFTVASGLESGAIKLSDEYDVEKPVKIGRFSIRDDHKTKDVLTVPEVYAYSSNIGTLKMARDIGVEQQMAFFAKLGLFDKAAVQSRERSNPLLPKQWGPAELATTSYGHGISVTPIHLVNGVAAMVNGGRLNPATLLRKDASEFGNVDVASFEQEDNVQSQVISPETSKIMRDLMHLAVEAGTGEAAKVDGYLIGGKTGTANKTVTGGGYNEREVVASFVSVMPIDDPQYLVFVLLDAPKANEHNSYLRSASFNAVPVVKNIIMRAGPLLGIQPIKKDEIDYDNVFMVSGEDR